ncbi:MAG: DUF1800 domain-containing protein [Dehalococcoidia bacterium]|nr:DUF1800 domain-containing protein [Dehalococcoidia bacterium]
MADNDIALMAHLMRRAGFGAGRDELEALVARGYESTVEDLIHPERVPDVEEDLFERYLPEFVELAAIESNQQLWMQRMISTKRPLQEKMALFWHGILCTGFAKVDNGPVMTSHIDLFRRYGLGNFGNLLMELSRNPAMVYFLDNVDNHKGTINENYGRELLELFSMGVGMDGRSNYTEDDVKAASRAFTGWNLEPTPPVFPYGRSNWKFRYDPADHDNGEKTFLGETGRWNGMDIIHIIMRQPATARFVSRHLYNFFVADEPQVPAWKDTPPRDMEAIRILESSFAENDADIRSVLRTLFNSDFFKEARFTKMKSPADVVVGTMRLVKDHQELKPGLYPIMQETTFMGQDLLNPPTVEGWHTGREWIDSGTLVERINFVADQVGNQSLPGVKLIVDRMSDGASSMSTAEFVDRCLDLLGPIEVADKTRGSLIEHAASGGELRRGTEEERGTFARRVTEMLQLIVATAEYQYA